jgi:hypothetical protein
MSNTCESAVQGPNKGLLGEIEGEGVVEVEILNGGHKYCRGVEIKLTSGKFLHILSHLDTSSYGITPRVEYKIGGWSRWEPRRDKKTDCEGQLYFSFANVG